MVMYAKSKPYRSGGTNPKCMVKEPVEELLRV
jgi:hypothetical protein